MADISIRNMTADDEYFVSTCSHVNESDETDRTGVVRLAWMKRAMEQGLAVKVALLDGQPAGFVHVKPPKLPPAGVATETLWTIPCLWVLPAFQKRGLGAALVEAAEQHVRQQNGAGLATIGLYTDFWFMPGSFFEKMGFCIAARQGNQAVLWKAFDETAEPPSFADPRYVFNPVEGKVVVDLFHTDFCLTVIVEAQRVREVVAEFGDAVVLNEYNADNPDTLARWQRNRGIFINGREIGWGYEAPKDGIRKAIVEAMETPRNPVT